MQSPIRRALALFLCAVMLVGMFPVDVHVHADDEEAHVHEPAALSDPLEESTESEGAIGLEPSSPIEPSYPTEEPETHATHPLLSGQEETGEPEAHEHSWVLLTRTANYHAAKCEVCQAEEEQAHTFDEEGYCTFCDYKDHDHKWRWDGETRDAYTHWAYCRICKLDGIITEEQQLHTFGSHGTCSVCAIHPVEHEHHWVGVGPPRNAETHLAYCDYCLELGIINREEQPHSFNAYDVCSVCSLLGKNHTHAWLYARNDDTHDKFCAYCPEKVEEAHVFSANYITTETHTLYCPCGKSLKNIAHTFDENGVCPDCGYRDHEHDYQWNPSLDWDEDEHLLQCVICAEYGVSYTQWNDHDYDENNICTVCGAARVFGHDHYWRWDGLTRDADTHWAYCWICDEDGIITEEQQPHTFDNYNICSVCGYVGAGHEHIWRYYSDGDYHMKYCRYCDIDEVPEAHTISRIGEVSPDYHRLYCSVCNDEEYYDHTFGEDGRCTECGYQNHVHNYQLVPDSYCIDNWGHILICDGCVQAGVTYPDRRYRHEYPDGSDTCSVCGFRHHEHDFQWNPSLVGDKEAHPLQCVICAEFGISIIWMESHNYDENNICTVCGYRDHEHDYQWNPSLDWDDEDHQLQCVICAENGISNTRWESHDYDENNICTVCGKSHIHRWVWDGLSQNAQTHWAYCRICADWGITTEEEQAHTFDNYNICSVCRYVYHAHTWVDATCTTPKTCSVCQETEGEALGHTWVNATCTTPKTCSVCQETEGDALGHTWVDATCTTPKTCSVCQETEGDALGHTWVDATCTTPKTCSVCQETEGDALGHTWVNATCTTPKTCSACQETEGDALGHTWVDATCTTPKTCSVCGETEGDALGHQLIGNRCTVCGYRDHEHNYVVDTIAQASHKLVCTYCGDSMDIAHSFVDGFCTVCETADHEHTFEAIRYFDVQNHVRTCSECGIEMLEAHTEDTCACAEEARAQDIKDSGTIQGENDTVITWEQSTSGALTFGGDGAITADAISEELKETDKLVIERGVTEIGENAFAELENVESVALPSTVEKIGEGAMPANAESVFILNPDAEIADNAIQGSDTVVYGYSGSTAETYAKANGLAFVSVDEPTIIPGLSGEEVKLEKQEEVSLYCTGNHEELEAVYLDDSVVSPGNYTVVEGSTIVIFTPSFLASLPLGSHTVSMSFNSEEAEAPVVVSTPLTVKTDIHHVSKAWSSAEGKHFHACTDEGCDYVEDLTDCSGGTATCTSPAECAVCLRLYGKTIAHTPNVEAATEETAKFCTICNTVLEQQLAHTHRLTPVEAAEPTCTVEGNIAHFVCDCGALFADENGTTEITNSNDVLVAAPGHKWVDADCTTAKTCSVCLTTEGNALGHIPSQWSTDSSSHWNECTRCSTALENAAHTAPNKDSQCDVCGYQFPVTHTHKFTSIVSKDSKGHTYRCSCGETKTEAHHRNLLGRCSSCGYAMSLTTKVVDSVVKTVSTILKKIFGK